MEEKLNQLITKVELVAQKLDILIMDKCNLHKALLDDHEVRIRTLEDNKNRISGRSKIYEIIIAAVIAVITGVLVKIL